MTLLSQTMLLYLVVGVGVAGAVYTAGTPDRGAERCFRVLTAWLFWPLYVPILLATPARPLATMPPTGPAPLDDMARAIAQVDAELDAALGSLDGWVSDVLARERDRIRELRAAWMIQAERVRDMDRLLALPDSPAAALCVEASVSERLRRSEQARRDNLQRLRSIRQQAHDDLMGMLAWVRELVSMIHLAKFTGAPAARAEDLVAQIAAAVEGLAETASNESSWSPPAGRLPMIAGTDSTANSRVSDCDSS
jgi:hypothetical protein